MVVYIREVLDDSWCKGTGGSITRYATYVNLSQVKRCSGTLCCPDMVADWGKLKILEQ